MIALLAYTGQGFYQAICCILMRISHAGPLAMFVCVYVSPYG